MPYVQAKCIQCGEILVVDNNRNAADCQYCGNTFIVQEAIDNFNKHDVYNEDYNDVTTNDCSSGAFSNVYENRVSDFVIEGGVLKKYLGVSLTPVVPEGVVAIEYDVFRGCAITKVTLPSTLKVLRSKFEINRDLGAIFYYGPFGGCSSLEEVVLVEGLTEIGAGAFKDCSSLKNIVIPNSVNNIGDEAFAGCKNLSPVDIPKSVTFMGKDVFNGVPYYDEIKAKEDNALKIKELNSESFENPEQLSELGRKYQATNDSELQSFGRNCAFVASKWQEYEIAKKKYDECLSAAPALWAFRSPMVIIGFVSLLWGFIIWFALMLLECIVRKRKAKKIKKSYDYIDDMNLLANRKNEIDGILDLIRRRDIYGVERNVDKIKDSLKLSCRMEKDRLRAIAESYEESHG